MISKKRALHLVVVAGLVGGIAVAPASPAHAVVLPPTNCAAYIQGDVDPGGGALPGGIIPFGISSDVSPGHKYGVVSAVTGGDGTKIINTLTNTTPAGFRFKASLTLQDAPLLGALGATLTKSALAVAWKNDANGAGALPTVALSESGVLGGTAHKFNVAKGTATNSPGPDSGPFAIGGPNPAAQHLVVSKGVTGGTFKLRLVLPGSSASSYLPTFVPTGALAYNASAATIAANLNGLWAGASLPLSSTVTGTPAVSGTSDGTYQVTTMWTAGPLSGTPASLSTLDHAESGIYPGIVAGNPTFTPSDANLSNGEVWNGEQAGGVDPSTNVITSLNGGTIWTTGVVFDNNQVGGTTTGIVVGGYRLDGKLTGKSTNMPDTQATAFMYPMALITAINPALSTNLAALFLIAALGLPADTDTCSFPALLALFCYAQAATIPADFAGFCQGIIDPTNV